MINRTFFRSIIAFLILSSCTSIPLPRGQEDSLVLFYLAFEPLVISGAALAEPLRVEPDADTLAWAALPAGTYTVQWTAQPGAPAAVLQVAPKVVKLTPPPGVEHTESDRQRALELFMLYLNFPEWVSRDLVGFGEQTLPPVVTRNTGELIVETDPPGASVYLDEANYGAAPFNGVFKRGKYTVRLNLPGYVEVQEEIDLGQKLELVRSLAPTPPPAPKEYKMLIVPFSEEGVMGLYSRAISDTLAFNFREGSIYRPIVEKSVLTVEASFVLAKSQGADLLVEGTYTQDSSGLVVRAVVWDVKEHRIRYMELFPVPGGVSVFEALDESSIRFAENAQRNFPKPGEAVIENFNVPKSTLLPLEQEGYRQWQTNQRDSLEYFASLGYVIGVMVPGFGSDPYQYTYNGNNYFYTMTPGLTGFELRAGLRLGVLGGPVVGFYGSYGASNGLKTDTALSKFTSMHLFFSGGYAFHFRQGGLMVYLMPALMAGTNLPLQKIPDEGFPSEGFDGIPLPVHVVASVEVGLQFSLNPKISGNSPYISTILKNFLYGLSFLGDESQPFKSMTSLSVGFGWEWPSGP